MLTSLDYDTFVDPIVDLYEEYIQAVINDIARRLAGLDYAKSTAAWQMQRLTESGMLYQDAIERLSELTGKSESALKSMFQRAGVKSMKFDDEVYRLAGLEPIPLNLSPAMAQVLAAGLQRTEDTLRNLTLSTLNDGQDAFVTFADQAYMQISSGAFDYNSAIRSAVSGAADHGLQVIQYAGGHHDQLDVAMRRAILTGVSQTAAQLQITRADEMGCDLVQTSAHIGARPSHQLWQGKVFSRSGTNKRYPNFVEETGYGTGPGLCGWNCVVGDTVVSGPTIRAAYRREYTGEIVIIRTSKGHKLTVTPNHPILTDKGWIAAGLLAEGDNVICRADFNGMDGTGPDPDHYKSRIEDVFNSLAQSGDMLRFPASTGYFHGDVSDGEVDVVFPQSLLGDDINSLLSQKSEQFSFGGTIESSNSLITDGALDKSGFTLPHSSDCIMSRLSEFCSTLGADSFQPSVHGVGAAISQRDTQSDEIRSDQTLGNSEFGGNLVFPETRIVHSEKFIGGDASLPLQVKPPVSRISDAVSFDAVHNGMDGTAVFVGDKLVSLPREEEIDNIVFVERKSTQGSFVHVYNLETEGGWYYANDIITHNCHHSFYPFFEGISENAYSQAERESFMRKTVKLDGQQMTVYDATQKQRYIERKIRYWKRQQSAMNAAKLDSSPETTKVRLWQGRMRSLIKQLDGQVDGAKWYRQWERERI